MADDITYIQNGKAMPSRSKVATKPVQSLYQPPEMALSYTRTLRRHLQAEQGLVCVLLELVCLQFCISVLTGSGHCCCRVL